QLHEAIACAERFRNERGLSSHAMRMSSRIIVAYLRSFGQAFDNFDLRSVEVLCSGPDEGLECAVVLLERTVKHPCLQKVSNAQEYFTGIERLCDEILGAEGKRASFRFRRRVAGQHQDRDVTRPHHAGSELLQNGKAIQVRHVKIEQNQIRLEL